MSELAGKLLFWGGAIGLVVLCKNQPYWKYLVCLFGWVVFVGLVNWVFGLRSKGRKVDTNPDPRLDTPWKALRGILNYQASNFLFILNPFILVQSVLQIVGLYRERIFGHPVLQAEQYKQKANYILPVAGEWRVLNGGVTRQTSHSWNIPTQRFAYDLVKFGQNERSFTGDGRKLTDYFCFDAPILAPADGVVVKASDGIHDAPFVGTFWMDCLTRDIAGNSVLIKHTDGEYCLLAHLKCGSVNVRTGQMVQQGQEIGRCGHSGNSTEPHLHFQFQDGKAFILAAACR
jgi:hypothetical protein